jgi:hypothetical protein
MRIEITILEGNYDFAKSDEGVASWYILKTCLSIAESIV